MGIAAQMPGFAHRSRQRVGQRHAGPKGDHRQDNTHAGALHRPVKAIEQEQAADTGIKRTFDSQVAHACRQHFRLSGLHENRISGRANSTTIAEMAQEKAALTAVAVRKPCRSRSVCPAP